MRHIRIVPFLLLRRGGLVKTTRFGNARYIGDPINVLRLFNDKEVDEVTVLGIAASREGIEWDLIQDFAAECFMPLCYGGGIAALDDARRLFAMGVEKVSLNRSALEQPVLISQIADIYGSQSVAVAIDVKSRRIGGPSVYLSGKRATGIEPIKHAVFAQTMGAGEIVLTSVDREGTGEGYDLDLVAKVSGELDIPVVAHGGAGSLNDLAAAIQAGASAAAAGSLFVYHGRQRAVLVNYPSPEEREAHGIYWT